MTITLGNCSWTFLFNDFYCLNSRICILIYRSVIDMSHVELDPYEGYVISLRFGAENEEVEDE